MSLFNRCSGTLLHISSLPSKYGIGDFGKEAYQFVDILKKSKISLWQILPLSPAGPGNSPYASISSYAGNPYLISLQQLVEQKLLTNNDLKKLPKFPKGKVDFTLLDKYKLPLLDKAAKTFIKKNCDNVAYKEFIENSSHWLNDYALFIAISEKFNSYCWSKNWDNEFTKKDETVLSQFSIEKKDRIEEIKVIQYLFFKQWFCLKAYANKNNIKIIGDMPIFVAQDSVEAWSTPHLFKTNSKGEFNAVSGYPPDSDGNYGQMWGNPVYNWSEHKKENFNWWINRIKHLITLTDYLRIDHFIGFYHYWEIPKGKQPIDGKWAPTFGKEMFKAMREKLGDLPIIAEDLGELTQEVIDLRDENKFPGMRVFEFGFSWKNGCLELDNPFLPANYITHCVAYSGTHDNEMLRSWILNKSEKEKNDILSYLECNEDTLFDASIRSLFASKANFVIIPIQDILNLYNDSRMNTPGTCGEHNWSWQLTSFKEIKKEAKHMANYNIRYSRA